MRFYPFGSGSVFPFIVSASFADYSIVAQHGLRTLSASRAISGSRGPDGDPGTPGSLVGPYNSYPSVCPP